MKNKIKNLGLSIAKLWYKLPDNARRVVHTFWQTYVAVFLLGATDIVTNIVKTGSLSDAKTALVALIVAAGAAALSAAKNWIAVYLGGRGNE